MISYILVGLVLVTDLVLQVVLRSYGLGIANKGIALGIFANANTKYLLFLTVVGLIWTITRFRELGILMMLGGGLINLVNRFVYGNVWDYIQLILVWVNLSDIVITIGLLLAIYESTRNRISRS